MTGMVFDFWQALLVPSLRRYYFEKFKVKQDCTLGFWATLHDDFGLGKLDCDFTRTTWWISCSVSERLMWRVCVGSWSTTTRPGFSSLYMSESQSLSLAKGCPSWTWFYPYHYAPETQFIVWVASTLTSLQHPESMD